MNEKRLYSLALASYIMTVKPDLKPEIKLDSESNTAYCVFPETEDIAQVIHEFRNGEALVSLTKYNANVRFLKNEFKKLTNPFERLKTAIGG